MKYLPLAAILAAALPAIAQAQDHRFTLASGYSYQQFDQLNAHATESRLSFDVNEFVSLEANILSGWSGSSAIACPAGANCTSTQPRARFRYGYGVSVAGHWPLTEQIDLFARAGYAAADFKVSVGSSGTEYGLNYGIGANYFFDDVQGVRLEYMRSEIDDLGGGQSWGISYVRRF